MSPLSIPRLPEVYSGRRVLVTGHTGFKGAWLVAWLRELGAQVSGFSLPAESPSAFDDLALKELCIHQTGDLRDSARVTQLIAETRPEVIFHLAAQALVRVSYARPVETLATNVMGTAHLLEAVRVGRRPCAVVVVTSDKCYENREWDYAYREDDPMGGHDVYSMSKGAAELVVGSYRRSFFPPERLAEHGVALASARAGNVIGGGDWARDRIVPDIVRALSASQSVAVRNQASVRPWQHVLEPLGGYLLLGASLLGAGSAPASTFCEPWNFGPTPTSTRTVGDLVKSFIAAWGAGAWQATPETGEPHEAKLLRLAIDKASGRLGWAPRWTFEETVANTAVWYRARVEKKDLRQLTARQIRDYSEAAQVGAVA